MNKVSLKCSDVCTQILLNRRVDAKESQRLKNDVLYSVRSEIGVLCVLKNQYYVYVGETESVSPFLCVKKVIGSNTLQTERGF